MKQQLSDIKMIKKANCSKSAATLKPDQEELEATAMIASFNKLT